jgi:hypothetical protein
VSDPVTPLFIAKAVAPQALGLLQQIGRKALGRTEQQVFVETLAVAMVAPLGRRPFWRSPIKGTIAIGKRARLRRSNRKLIRHVETAKLSDFHIAPLPPPRPDAGAVQLARNELLAACSRRDMLLWRQRLLGELAGAAAGARTDWSETVTGSRDGSRCCDQEILEWAAGVVCRFEVGARERESLRELIDALDRQDAQATQLVMLETMQGIRLSAAFGVCGLAAVVALEAARLL